MRVSHETIYQSLYVQGRGALRRELAKSLRTGRALRKPRRTGGERRGKIPGMINISERRGLERHGGRVPAGLWARIVQRLLALNAAIWHNWQIGAPVKRSLIAYDH